ncbi:hypothetical protein MtrunA17_Chr8g0337681 [Medicago truncatula]|uniref:RALF-like protein n=1 Tax=Medicago truncatula TaxID=3880 RepID=A0A072TKT8_MEDTR|nr:RALF-like protein [Medicago truncatula]RHN38859.1 hypothetical protein MtrunA17_Chr8g0337681 [Medicago truncatula]
MASKIISLIWVSLILCVFSLCAMKLAGASELHSSSYEMVRSRRLLGQEQTGGSRSPCGASLINDQNKQASDQPRCGNYRHQSHP